MRRPPVSAPLRSCALAALALGLLGTLGAPPVAAQNSDFGALSETYFGTVRARDITSLSFEARGCIVEVDDAAKTSRQAQGGQVLVRLDDQRARLAVRMAEARLADLAASVEERQLAVAAAQADYDRRLEESALVQEEFERNSGLQGRGLINATTMDTIERRFMDARFATDRARETIANTEAALKRAEIALALGELDHQSIEIDLSKTVLSAPFDGVLVGFEANLGDCVQDGALAARVYRPDQKSVDVFFPISRLTEAGAQGLEAGATVSVTRTNGETCNGTITRIDTEADTETQFVEATVDIEPACAPGIFLNEAVEIRPIPAETPAAQDS